jgi:hypothetical protein
MFSYLILYVSQIIRNIFCIETKPYEGFDKFLKNFY